MAGSIVEQRKLQKQRKDIGLTRVEAKHIPTYGGSFDHAFAQARSNGDLVFRWTGTGGVYGTNLYDWDSKVKKQKKYANYKEKLLGRKRWKTIPEDRFRTIGQFNPETGLTRYFIEDREMSAEDELSSLNSHMSEPTWGMRPMQFVKDNSGKIMSFDSPQAAKKFMKSEEFADYAGQLEIEAPRHKIPKRERRQEGLLPIYRTDLMGDNGMRDGRTRLWFDTSSRLYLLADENGDIMWFTPDPNCENEGWGTTPGSNGFVPVNDRTDQFREAWADYLGRMNQASETAGASPYTRPDLYGALYENPVAQDIAAARNDFSRGAVNYFNSIIRLPYMLGETAISRAPGLGLPTYNFWEHIGSNFDNTDAPGLGDFLADAFIPNSSPLNGYGRAALNFAGDVLTTGGFASFVPESGVTYSKIASTKNLPGVARFEYNPSGPTIKLGNEAGQVLIPTRNGRWNLGKNVPEGINNGYSLARVTNDKTPYVVYNPRLGVSGMNLFGSPGYFEWTPKQFDPTFFDYYGGNPMPTTYIKTGKPGPFNGKYVIIGPQEGSGELNMHSGRPYGEYLETLGPAPDNIKVETTEHNLVPGYKHGGQIKFPVFKNNKRIN